jgi:hypothetical protein
VRHIKIIHRMTPAENPVLGEKSQKNGNQNIGDNQLANGKHKAKKLFNRDFAGLDRAFCTTS